MTASVVWTGLVLLFLVIFIWTMIRENQRKHREFLRKMKKSWGQVPDREYTWDQLEQIAGYYKEQKADRFVIDDVTWNDLDLDRVFLLINQTVSSPGEDYLYYMLRTPEFSKEKLQERERLFQFFQKNEKARQRLQEILAAVRRPPSVSLYKAVHVEKDCYIGNPGKQRFLFGAFLASLLAFIIIPQYGVFLFLLMGCVNIGLYLKEKEKINAYLLGFRCVIQLLQAIRSLEKEGIEELSDYTQRLIRCKKALGKFESGAFLVLNRGGMESGPESILLDYVRMMTHVDLIKFNSMMKAMKEHEKETEEIISVLGFLDACISVASFRELLPYFCCPEFTDYRKGQRAKIEVENLYHPLISEPIANSITAKQAVLVTGSNASGKSTFLKNLALNAILAQTIHTCTATACRMHFYKTMTSMALRDDLESSESYYIVEIRSLKRILDEGKNQEIPILCMIDEVLRGTNTIERIAASSRILAALNQPHILPFAATHDIELTYMLEDSYKNYHFEEEVKENDVVFSYLLKEGRVTTRNAIRLLQMVGYDRSIVEASKQAVVDFEKTGIWKKAGEEICL